jgi:hypothetical protein
MINTRGLPQVYRLLQSTDYSLSTSYTRMLHWLKTFVDNSRKNVLQANLCTGKDLDDKFTATARRKVV